MDGIDLGEKGMEEMGTYTTLDGSSSESEGSKSGVEGLSSDTVPEDVDAAELLELLDSVLGLVCRAKEKTSRGRGQPTAWSLRR